MEFKSLEQLFEENNGRTVVMDRRKYRGRNFKIDLIRGR